MIQVLTIGSAGEVSGLRMPCGMGIDLRSFGRIQVNRVSDIMFDAAVQLYYVKFVAGPLKGETPWDADLAQRLRPGHPRWAYLYWRQPLFRQL